MQRLATLSLDGSNGRGGRRAGRRDSGVAEREKLCVLTRRNGRHNQRRSQ